MDTTKPESTKIQTTLKELGEETYKNTPMTI